MTIKSKEEVVQEYRIQSIQDAAMHVIARKGMAGATMQEIAEEAGVAKGTIYLYFRDRDELVEKTFETAITHLLGRIESAMAAGQTFEEKLRGAMSAKFAYFGENREFFRLYISLRVPEGSPHHERRQKRKCQNQYNDALARLATQAAEAMDRGEIRRTDPHRLALFIAEGSNAIVVQRVMEENAPPEEADVAFVTDMIMGGLRPHGV